MCDLIVNKTSVCNSYSSNKKWTDMIKIYIGLHLQCHLAWQIVMELEFYRQIFKKSSNIEFHENNSSGNRVVSCGRTDGLTWRSYESILAILLTRQKVLKKFPQLLTVRPLTVIGSASWTFQGRLRGGTELVHQRGFPTKWVSGSGLSWIFTNATVWICIGTEILNCWQNVVNVLWFGCCVEN